LGEPLLEMARSEDTFILTTPARTLQTPRLILTTGGRSYPGSGTTGDGYAFAVQFGHTIVTPRPALVPLTTNIAWVAELRGLTLEDLSVAIVEGGSEPQAAALVRRRGPLLSAH